MTPAQIAADIKRLDKEIAKADEGIHAKIRRPYTNLIVSAHRAGMASLRVVSTRDSSAVYHTPVKDRSVLCVERRLLRASASNLLDRKSAELDRCSAAGSASVGCIGA